MGTQIHPSAIVSAKAELGENVQIGPYCLVDDNVKIGDGTELRAFVRVCGFTEIGAACTFYDHSTIGGDPQDLSYKGEKSFARIGDGVVCREYVTVNRAVGEGEATVICDKSFIMEGVHVAHNVKIGRECTIANKVGFAGHACIGDYVVIGGMSGFHQFVHVGSYCMIGGLSRITQDVPPYSLASGIPLRVYDINRIGLKRRGFDSRSRMLIRKMYRLVYHSGKTVREGLVELKRLYGDEPAAKVIIDFAAEATRGFVPSIKQGWKKGGENSID